MPTYGYRCTSCSHEFEEFQSISEATMRECPSCKKGTLIRIIGGGAGLVFKGSGFYLTDYKKTSTNDDEKKSLPKKTSETKSDTPSSTPPATPPPSSSSPPTSKE